jgi:hypothetical protein
MHNRGAVVFDGALTDAQIGCDILAEMFGEHQIEHLTLACGESCRLWMAVCLHLMPDRDSESGIQHYLDHCQLRELNCCGFPESVLNLIAPIIKRAALETDKNLVFFLIKINLQQ